MAARFCTPLGLPAGRMQSAWGATEEGAATRLDLRSREALIFGAAATGNPEVTGVVVALPSITETETLSELVAWLAMRSKVIAIDVAGATNVPEPTEPFGVQVTFSEPSEPPGVTRHVES